MATTWLSLAEVAKKNRRTQIRLRDDIDRGEFPAPEKFLADQTPRWKATTAAYDFRRTPQPGNVMTKDDHVMHLYDEVLYWVMQHGHAEVPQHAVGRNTRLGSSDPFPLGARVSSLRSAYSLGRLNEKHVKMFEAIPGWAWDHWAVAWNSRLDDVLLRFPDDLTAEDRAWLATQRLRFEKLRTEWQERLKSVPGLFDVQRRSRAREFVEAVHVWLAHNPDYTTFGMPYSARVDIDGTSFPVGRRATYYRRRYRGLEGPSKQALSDEDVELIEALPGWTWENPSELMGAVRPGKER